MRIVAPSAVPRHVCRWGVCSLRRGTATWRYSSDVQSRTATTNGATKVQLGPVPVAAVPAKSSSAYPLEFQSLVQGRTKQRLGDYFGLSNFGVNYTTLEPGSTSALLHYHSRQDELIVILKGTATLKLGEDEILMPEGSCMGFPAGKAVGHCVMNQSDSVVEYLEVGDRTPGDVVAYPDDDMTAIAEQGGKWKFYHKDGRPYEMK